MNTKTDATDRTGCKAFCGLRYRDFETTDGVCRAGAEAAYNSWLDNVGIQALDGPGDELDRHVWCSDHCRDARLPPIAAPQSKIEVKATVDGKCPLCGVAVPSTHIHLCSPQHVERRKGQVWRLTDGRDKSREYTLSHRYGATRWACKGFGDCGLEDVCWEGRYEMELIADATAEPGKQAAYPATPCVKCGRAHTGECGYPTHEAPKATPVQPGLVVEMPCDGCGEANDVEWFQVDNMTRVFCEPCRIEALVWMSAQTGTPYKGPERLRSVLALDEMVEADWLPEVG